MTALCYVSFFIVFLSSLITVTAFGKTKLLAHRGRGISAFLLPKSAVTAVDWLVLPSYHAEMRSEVVAGGTIQYGICVIHYVCFLSNKILVLDEWKRIWYNKNVDKTC